MNLSTHLVSFHGRQIQLTLKPTHSPNCKKVYVEASEGLQPLCGIELVSRADGWHVTPPVPRWVVGFENLIVQLLR